MGKFTKRLEELDRQGIKMGPIIDPIFIDCPHCGKPHTYLGPQKCKFCGKLISLEETQSAQQGETV